MLRSVFLIGSLAAVVFGQSCNPDKLTAPCDTTLPCSTGSTCDTTQGSCCLDADLVTTTAASGTTVIGSSSTVTGSTVTTRTTSSSSTSCVDKTNPTTGVSDCAARKALCNDTVYYDVMTQQCPKTCGRCSSVTSSTSSGSCVDLKNPKTGVSDCTSMAAYCNDSNYITLMRTQCPKTCGFCGSSTTSSSSTSTVSSGTCVDKVNPATGVSDCASQKSLCNNSVYTTVMRAQCPKTCGFC